jgi:hypothetical protein
MQCVQQASSHQRKSSWMARFTDSDQEQKDHQDMVISLVGIWYLETVFQLVGLAVGEQEWK